MPFYEYKCKCGKIFDVLHLPGKDNGDVICPACGAKEVSRLISKPFLPSSVGAPADLKGSGSGSCCGSSPDKAGCTPGSCCGADKTEPVH
ncbi:putative regulatory protein, FmdB family [Desulfotomaculum arcticum]|uniref:Putative regulatory protein, FmdB family n=1 Tax=Desulfotruncus arcticus DSM 17038 TaxID=1121424 RepID=A0A1I2RHL7_9FIRM|nr:zinc ribbon domain-containing protein [Desulfotruncus arcticus]SFG39920.1 putative regulatory protein, FmdB family [Desulfotomaculum arcticum] [Desulfotruncus arcticus DSM 17038]